MSTGRQRFWALVDADEVFSGLISLGGSAQVTAVVLVPTSITFGTCVGAISVKSPYPTKLQNCYYKINGSAYRVYCY